MHVIWLMHLNVQSNASATKEEMFLVAISRMSWSILKFPEGICRISSRKSPSCMKFAVAADIKEMQPIAKLKNTIAMLLLWEMNLNGRWTKYLRFQHTRTPAQLELIVNSAFSMVSCWEKVITAVIYKITASAEAASLIYKKLLDEFCWKKMILPETLVS